MKSRPANEFGGFGLTVLAFCVAAGVPLLFGAYWLSVVIVALEILGIWAYSVWEVKP